MSIAKGPRIKGNIIRVWASAIEKAGLMPRIQSRLSKETLEVLRKPPLAGSWTAVTPLAELFLAVHDVCGRDAALKFARQTTRDIAPFYTGMIGALLRLFGTSPASLFSRLNELIKQTMDGLEYRWQSTGDRSGTIEIFYPAGSMVQSAQFLNFIPTIEMMFELCKVKGTVSDPTATSDRSAKFTVGW